MKSVVIALVIGAIIVAAVVLNNKNTSTTKSETVVPSVMQNQDLKAEDLQVGTGDPVKKGDTIVIHYKGMLTNGQEFDSSYKRSEPFETQIGVGNVIQGWDQGVIGMKKGGKRRLTIPPSMGYGDQATGSIPPNSTLVFDLELLEIK